MRIIQTLAVALLGYWYATLLTPLVSMTLAATQWGVATTYAYLLAGWLLAGLTVIGAVLAFGVFCVIVAMVFGLLVAGFAKGANTIRRKRR